jgi:F-type H+-transporting ATPase subunit gamma
MKINKKELDTLEYLRDIVEAYEEIASIRMRRVKSSVLQTREFLDGLRKVFYQVKYVYTKEVARLEKDSKNKYIRNTNGKTVSVLLSANTGLYGDITLKTFESFVKHAKNTDTDIAVVGKVGKRQFSALEGSKFLEGVQVKYFNLSDSGLDRENTKTLLAHLVSYETIIVFHGKFKDILTQEPAAVSISGDVLQADIESFANNVRYIFEPSLEDVMKYFETEILSSIFDQSIHESNLSKYASRMISLDHATERINSAIYKSRLLHQKGQHRMRNNRQLNTYAGIMNRITKYV